MGSMREKVQKARRDVYKRQEKSGYDVLLQKRSQTKDSNPGSYDISSAGHVDAGDEILESAIRELKEELGIEAKPEELHYIGVHYGAFEAEFYGKMFRDRELSSVYVYTEPVEIENLKLQKEEVEAVRWMDYEAVSYTHLDVYKRQTMTFR